MFAVQPDNNPEHPARSTDLKMYSCVGVVQSKFRPKFNSWSATRLVFGCLQARSPSKLTGLELFGKEIWKTIRFFFKCPIKAIKGKWNVAPRSVHSWEWNINQIFLVIKRKLIILWSFLPTCCLVHICHMSYCCCATLLCCLRSNIMHLKQLDILYNLLTHWSIRGKSITQMLNDCTSTQRSIDMPLSS